MSHNTQTLVTSLLGRARALEQLAGMVETMPAWRRKSRRRRALLVDDLRREARRAYNDIEMARWKPS